MSAEERAALAHTLPLLFRKFPLAPEELRPVPPLAAGTTPVRLMVGFPVVPSALLIASGDPRPTASARAAVALVAVRTRRPSLPGPGTPPPPPPPPAPPPPTSFPPPTLSPPFPPPNPPL